ncbi:hypothetical protein TSTA_118890 [Talaromyces stipitatus ATCC 10500]|uniref:HAT C-terminal dimerisation domain-containing protein n=1 Tax=Talaromyces stipitatus (strain ATCC 10500 / CBS 375.48 / QM 6759 / NRRL 1006) TaxID=441959 RepID=B8M9X3_TALSN|nr:uncharacterized protein TSTA_118890 [Talaromyces stipitatus ATCC 10500]EED18125.1 hypothetical protein TSTA_118890 [Talaromyces stipitatus ATCC 10500]
MALALQLPFQPEANTNDEPTPYLGSSPTKPCSPRVFWKENENNFPVLARLVRDVLTVPATGSGVERLFNSARDICHYCRGSLKSRTIQDLVIFMCTSRLEIESEQLALLEEYISTQEIQTRTEENAANKAAPMVDMEEEEDEDEEGNEEDEIPLPDNTRLHDQNSTQRRKSGRVTKRSKQDDSQWEYLMPQIEQIDN